MGNLVHGGKIYARVNNGIGSVLTGTYIPSSTTGSDGQIYLRHLKIPNNIDLRESITNSEQGAYFKTGYTYKENTRFECKFNLSSGATYPTTFGCREDTSGQNTNQTFFATQGSKVYYAFGNAEVLTDGVFSSSTDVTVCAEKSGLKMLVGNALKYLSTNAFYQAGTYEIYLFVANLAGSPWASSWSVMTLYYFKIYEDDVLVHYFLPAVDGSNIPCLYDAITGNYLYNQGTGTLTVGNSLSADNEIIKAYAKAGGDWNDLIGTSIDAITDKIQKETIVQQLEERVNSSSSRIVTSSDESTTRSGWCAFNGVHPTNLREPQDNTCWFASSSDTTPYIQYDLLNEYRLSRIRLDCFSNYSGAWSGEVEVLGSTDGISWTNILQVGLTAPVVAELQSLTSIVISLDASRAWRFVRIRGTSAFDVPFAPSLFIDEIFIYGYVSENVSVGDLRFSTWDSLKRIESTSCMTLSATDTTLTSTYIGGVTIGCNFTIPIDVSNVDTIQGTVDIGTGYSLTQLPFYVALCEQYPDTASVSTPSSWSPVVTDTTNVANSTYNFSLDTSNLSGGYFLVFILTGMNATIRDIQAITGG